MTQKTVTRADLAEAVYEAVGLSRTESAELVERVFGLRCQVIDDPETGTPLVVPAARKAREQVRKERVDRGGQTAKVAATEAS